MRHLSQTAFSRMTNADFYISTTVPGSGHFKLSVLAGLVYGLGFWIHDRFPNINQNPNPEPDLTPILTLNLP